MMMSVNLCRLCQRPVSVDYTSYSAIRGPRFAIIVGAITAMGGLQYLVHGAAYDKPRAIGLDAFDRLVKARDERARREATGGGGSQRT